uniref:Transmembrane protein n=1 Tax=Strongyloides venezuelensis TaxID=75913 RepID=A0A0K0F996_STRVS
MSGTNGNYYNGMQMTETSNEATSKLLLMIVSFMLGVATMVIVLISQGRIAFKTKKNRSKKTHSKRSTSDSSAPIPMTEIQKVVSDLQKKNQLPGGSEGMPQIVVVQKKK